MLETKNQVQAAFNYDSIEKLQVVVDMYIFLAD